MRLEFGGRLDRWLEPDDPMMCECGEELDDERCRNERCDYYEPVPDEEEEE